MERRTAYRAGGASPLLPFLLLLTTLSPHPARADCECGYRVGVHNTTDDTTQQYVLTDLLETNFANMSGDVAQNTDWVRQAFNTTAAQARGAYGQMTAVDNVNIADDDGGGDGLELTVRAGTTEGMVQGGEIDTARLDVFYGTFRSSMRLTNVSGTVSAFFWVRTSSFFTFFCPIDERRSCAGYYTRHGLTNCHGRTQYFNDTQEIDVEFLSRDFDSANDSYPVHLVLQSRDAQASGYDASSTRTYQVVNLPFDPRGPAFHEYRMDFVPGRVVFYADGAVLADMTSSSGGVPVTAGHLALNHWANGNADWSGGPPAADAVTEVRYVKAYFNSSAAARQGDFGRRCVDPEAAGAVCDIPEVTPTDDAAAGWFFTGQANMTDNQTVAEDNGVSGGSGSGSGAVRPAAAARQWWVWMASLLVLTSWLVGL